MIDINYERITRCNHHARSKPLSNWSIYYIFIIWKWITITAVRGLVSCHYESYEKYIPFQVNTSFYNTRVYFRCKDPKSESILVQKMPSLMIWHQYRKYTTCSQVCFKFIQMHIQILDIQSVQESEKKNLHPIPVWNIEFTLYNNINVSYLQI